MQKLVLDNPRVWDHHRSGWAYAINAIRNKLCGLRGVLLEGYVDGVAMQDLRIKRPWVGFIHNPATIPDEAYALWPKMLGADRILESQMWKDSVPSCLGLFTLSQHCADFLIEHTDLPVSVLLHPTGPGQPFSLDRYLRNKEKKLISIGQWLRNLKSLVTIETKLQKVVLKPFAEFGVPDGLKVLERVSDFQYDELLSENVVILDLYAANANNVIIECMVRSTPMILRRHPPIVEYLGSDYPLFFDDIREVAKLTETDAIIKGHRYLAGWGLTERLTAENFVREMEKSDVYRSL